MALEPNKLEPQQSGVRNGMKFLMSWKTPEALVHGVAMCMASAIGGAMMMAEPRGITSLSLGSASKIRPRQDTTGRVQPLMMPG